jgi:Hypothetical protein (DUF2513)
MAEHVAHNDLVPGSNPGRPTTRWIRFGQAGERVPPGSPVFIAFHCRSEVLLKRDMDLVRKILLAIEAHPDERLLTEPLISGSSAKVVNYHLRLLYEAGFVEAVTWKGGNKIDFGAIGLTWRGHEFLDTARDETIWQKAKTKLGGALNTVSLAVLQDVLVSLVKNAAGLP